MKNEESGARRGYYFSILMIMVCVCAIPGWVILATQFGLPDLGEVGGMKISIIGLIALEIAAFAGFRHFDRMRIETRKLLAYDENGMSREMNDYQNLSKAERDMLDKERIADTERILSSGEIAKRTKRGSEDPEADMESLIGLEEVKDMLEELSARVEFEQQIQEDRKRERRERHGREQMKPAIGKDVSSNHLLFLGNPGTGKTTAARIVTGFFYKCGIIQKNQYIEMDGNSLRGQSIGDTSKRTELILQKARGKVLFIDEAYAMFTGDDAQEVIATLVKKMEDERGNFVLILAGYEREMETLIQANSGFLSRFGYVLHFKDYDVDQLCDIFTGMAEKNGFTVSDDAMDAFVDQILDAQEEKNFGNARACRTMPDKAISRHALNLKRGKINEESRYTIERVDLE